MLIYAIPNADKKLRVQFCRRLYDYKVDSHKGRYSTTTRGILDKFERPTRSCIIFEKSKMKKIKELCDEFKIQVMFYKVERIS